MSFTAAGVEDLLLSAEVDVLVVDEIDKVDVEAASVLQPLRITKANKTAEVKKLVGMANVERRTWVWTALEDRLLAVEFEAPDVEELKRS